MVHKYGSASYTQIKEALLIMYSVDDGVFMVYFALQFHCLFIAVDTRQTRDIESLLVQCWTSVVDGGPTLNQQWLNIWCFLGRR